MSASSGNENLGEKATVSFRTQRDLYRSFKAAVARRGETVCDVLCRAMQDYINRYG